MNMKIFRSLAHSFMIFMVLVCGKTQLYGQAPYKVMFFLLEDCKICLSYTQEIKTLHEKFSKDSFEFEAVFSHPASSPEGIEIFLKDYDLQMVTIIDQAQLIASKHSIKLVPEVLVLDTRTQKPVYQGRIDNSYAALGRKRPAPTERDLFDCLSMLSRGEYPKYRRTKGFGCFLEKKED